MRDAALLDRMSMEPGDYPALIEATGPKRMRPKHLPGRHDQSSHGRGRRRVPDVAPDVPAPVAVAEPKPVKPPKPRRAPKPKPPPRTEAPRAEAPKPRRPELDREISEAAKEMRDVEARARSPLAKLESLDKRARTRGLRPADMEAQERAEEELAALRSEGGFWANRQLELLSERDGEPWGGDAPDMPTAKPHTSRVPNANHDAAARAFGEYVVDDKKTIANNASLRSGSPSAEAKAWRARLADAVRSQRIETDSVVHRGAALKPETIMKLKPGAVLTDAGLISTDESRDQAQFYAESRARKRPGHLLTMFEIKTPAGTPGYDADYGEFVFDSPMRILSTKRTANGIEVSAEMLAPERG